MSNEKMNVLDISTQDLVSTKKDVGVVSCGYLSYKGESYKITCVTPGGLECDTDKLFGKYGDEFPLELLKTI